jgi:Tfp pilus assembly protein PilN
MIKVNLLRNHAAPARKPLIRPRVSQIGLIFAAMAVLAAGALGAWTYHLHQQVRTSTEKRDQLRVEEARLQALKQEIAKFEELKQKRQNRIDVIEKLKSAQKGPVLLLNSIIQSIPRDGLLWLTSLDQKSERVKIVGFTQHTEVIPDFMTNLMQCGIFQSVDLENIEAQQETSKFSLVCLTGKKIEAE